MANTSSSPSNVSKGFIMANISSSLSTVPVEPVNQKLSGDFFIRPHLRKLPPYQPILPFEVTGIISISVFFCWFLFLNQCCGFASLFYRFCRLNWEGSPNIIKLDANENPYGPPPEVLEALGSLKFPYIYPDPESRQLRAALAEDSGIGSDYILVGCGCNELINLIMRCVLDPGDKILDCPPTFTMYEFDAGVNAAQVIKVPRKPDFSLNVEAIAEAVEWEKPKCTFLTSPNNPDGSIISDEVLLKILEMPILVVLDEAYIEFSGIESRMQWVKFLNFCSALAFSFCRYRLAGIHVGYGSFPLSIIEYLWRAKQPYNVPVAAEVAACAALQNPKYLEVPTVPFALFGSKYDFGLMVKEALVAERERLFELLNEVPFLNPYPSHSNFILCELTSGIDAKKLKEDLSKTGVMVRHYDNKELKGYIRVTAGKPDHTNALMDCLRSLS
ncbi:histidinol-phosphate aminotransferase, chloroplastic-like [Hibiscus syriacus]|nr:histidinol-phosphate aminotransferase, chloroplastic-like [Hibiscus syriacus]